MRIGEKIIIPMTEQADEPKKSQKDDNIISKSNSFFAGNIFDNEKIFQNKERAKKQASEIIGKVFEGQQRIDKEVADIEQKIEDAHKEIDEGLKGLAALNKEKEALKESYGIDAEHNVDYQREVQELEAAAEPYKDKIAEGRKNIMAQSTIVKAIHFEELKHHDMVNAQKEADSIMAAASEMEISRLMKEAIEHMEEEEKEAEELAEDKEESVEERQEEVKEKAIEERNLQENVKETDIVWEEAQAEVEKILQRLNLLEEDIKGSEIDMKI